MLINNLEKAVVKGSCGLAFRLGQISFVNCLPIDFPLSQIDQEDFLIDKLSGSPAFINQQIREGQIDLAPISSYEYLTNQTNYIKLENLSISSLGAARSVLLLVKSFSDWQCDVKKIHITDKSATSVNLLKIILSKKYNFDLNQIEFIRFADDSSDYPIRLLIGDEALRVKQSDYDLVLDLGLEWFELTGLPMVFALWAVNKHSKLAENLVEVNDFFLELKHQGLEKYYPEILAQASCKTALSRRLLDNYFQGLNYDFSSKHKKSLELFAGFIEEFGLIY